MSLRNSISLSAFVFALAAGPSLADVTADDVWADWKSYMEGFGYTLTASERLDGSTLTISNLAMTYLLPEGEGSFTTKLPNLIFTETGSGSVNVTLPTEMPLEFDMKPPQGDSAKGVLMVTQQNPVMVVSGDPTDMTYTSSSDALTVTLASLEVDGSEISTEQFDMNVTLEDLSAVTRMEIGDVRGYTQNMSMGALTYSILFDIPDGPDAGNLDLKGSMNGATFSGTGKIPTNTDVNDVNAMLDAGFAIDGGFSFDAGETRVNAVTPDGPFAATSTSEGGSARVVMGDDGLTYDAQQTNLVVSAQQIPQFPFPVSFEMGKSAFNLTMPLRAKDSEQDFAFGLTLGDFSVSEVIWNLFDPAAQLPRDPATIALDLTGKAKVLLNFMDPEQAILLENGTAPGELNALNINSILLSAAGAEVSGNGAFTFDNSDTTTFDGMPKPEGALDVRVSGANGLMDTLVSMGLLPQEQVLGARMMMGLFGVQQGDDVLTSKIEVNPEGHVLANGQRLR